MKPKSRTPEIETETMVRDIKSCTKLKPKTPETEIEMMVKDIKSCSRLKPRTPEMEIEMSDKDPFNLQRRGSMSRSPPRLQVSDLGGSTDELQGNKQEKGCSNNDKSVKDIRGDLEAFLYNDSNKVNRNAIKFIMNKWSELENRLHKAEIANSKLTGKIEALEEERIRAQQLTSSQLKTRTFSQVVGSTPATTRFLATDFKINDNDKTSCEAVLIKPIREDDKRNNDEIKETVLKQLDSVKNKIKIKSIRQMRQKGLVMELQGSKNVDLIKLSGMQRAGLKIESPKKLSPTLVIYGVEKELSPDELKEDLINKNFEHLAGPEREELREKVNFRHSFSTKENKVNWIVQIPGR
ncbi:unnamed protein product, partial [Lasius platythorax]